MAAKHDPIREWREGIGRHLVNLDFKPLFDVPFSASFEPILDGMRMVRTAFSPGLTFRDEELLKDGNDSFLLLISQSKNLDVVHRGRYLQLSGGEAVLLHVCDTGTVGSREQFKFVAMVIPFPELEARAARLDNVVAQRVARRCEPLSLLRGYLGTLEKCRSGFSAEARESIRGHIFDLVALAIAPHGALGESSLGAVAAARINVALDHITAHFQNPELTVASIARSLGISPRYLQRLLETLGTSFTARVNELRLQRAFTLLTESGNSARRISDIALEVGFSDISHFNRLFRSRFGDTPSGVRAQGCRGR